ncbi:MAG TPA: nucleotidyltransferase domain-containing protein [archaeon]|nr:nucleotidyltransferase domain-containing protein [archaeon]
MTESVGKKLRKFSVETRFDSANKLKDKLLDLFKGYIKSVVVWGSVTRGDYTGKSDVDIYVIFDDTKMPLKKFDDIRDKIDGDMKKAAESVDPRLHVQPILALTEFWDGIRNCHPLFYNIVREGYAIYDTGFFIPLRKLLEWGKFPATSEAAEIRLESAPKRLSRVKSVKLYMIAEDVYMAMLDAAQALLMYVGVGPPPPKRAGAELRKHLVTNGLLEEEYPKMMDDVIDFRKKVEHKEINEVSGKEVDDWIEKGDRFVKKMEELLHKMETQRKADDVKKNYEVMIKASVAALKSLDKLPPEPEKLSDAFKKYLVDSGLVNSMYHDVLGKVISMRRMLEEKKLEEIPERDVYMSKEYVRRFLVNVKGILEKNPPKLEKAFAAEEKMDKAKKEIETAKEEKKIEQKIEAKEKKRKSKKTS